MIYPQTANNTPPANRDRLAWLGMGIVIISIMSYQIASIRPGHWFGSDFVLYMQHARNIAEGTPYQDTYFIYHSATAEHSPRAYPPVLPALLAAVYGVRGMDIFAMKLIVIGSFGVFLAAFFWWLQHRFSSLVALVIATTVALVPVYTTAKDDILSDLPFMAIAFLTLALLDHDWTNRTKSIPRFHVRHAIVIGALSAAAIATRNVGLVFIPTIMFAEAWKHRKLTRFGVIAALVAAFYFLAQELWIAETMSYGDQVRGQWDHVPRNVAGYSLDLLNAYLAGLPRILKLVGMLVGVILATIGFVVSVRRPDGPSYGDVFFLLYFMVICIWPIRQGIRFAMPLIPFLPVYLTVGGHYVMQRLGVRHPKLVWGPILGLILAAMASLHLNLPRGPMPQGFTRPDVTAMTDALEHFTDLNAVVVTALPRQVGLLAKRRATRFSSTYSDAQQIAFLQDIKATHILARKDAQEDLSYLIPFLERHRSTYPLLWESASYALYGVQRDGYR